MWLDYLKGLLQVLWMIVQLLFTVVKALIGLGALSSDSVREAAHNITTSVVAWVTSVLLLSPFDWIGGQKDIATENVAGGLTEAFTRLGMSGLPRICIDAGLALTMIAFFYGFAESSVQLDKNNFQQIFSRVLRWLIAVGLVTISYRLFGYLFMAFRSFYSLTGGTLTEGKKVFDSIDNYSDIKKWFDGSLSSIKPPALMGDTNPMIDAQTILNTDMSEVPGLSSGGTTGDAILSIRNGGVGVLILFFGLVKLCKKAIKFVVEQVPAFIKVVVFFAFAPLGLAMYASPETQQKANSYMRQFGGVVLINLFKVIAISAATVLVCGIKFPVDTSHSYSILNTMPVVSGMVAQAFNNSFGSSEPMFGWFGGVTISYPTAALATDVAFLITGGGLLGYQLYFDLISKASEISERFAQEVVS